MADKIGAERRESFGKGAARKIRAAGKIPAVIYGHGTDPVHVSLPGARDRPDPPQGERRARPRHRGQAASSRWSRTCRRTRCARSSSTSTSSSSAAARRSQVEVPVHARGRVGPGHHRRTRRARPCCSRSRPPTSPSASSSRSRASTEGTQITAGDVTLPRARRCRRPASCSSSTSPAAEVDLASRGARRPPRRPPRPTEAAERGRGVARRELSSPDRRWPTTLARRRARQPRAQLRRQPAQRRSDGARRAREPHGACGSRRHKTNATVAEGRHAARRRRASCSPTPRPFMNVSGGPVGRLRNSTR